MPGIIGSYIGESYRIESELGSGGMGDVYRAVELATGDEVAIKVIKPKAIADPDRLRRFRNEAKAASSIRHPNIVAVREVGAGEIDGQMRDYIVMELVAGSTLQHRIDGRPLLLSEALHFAIQIVSALEAAHKAGVVHRDVKPANVMIDATGTAKLADFGLAKIAGPPADPFAETGSMQLDLTNDGSIIGSVSYMSPEQARGLDVDFRSDIFSFGAVLYEMLSGKPAFDGATRAD
jgi:serine/threonine protein kinase